MIGFDEAKRRVLNILATTNKFNWVATLKRDPELVEHIESHRTPSNAHVPLKEFAFELFVEDPTCKNGKRKKFVNSVVGWSMCGKGSTCACFAEMLRTKQKETKAAIRSEVREKAVATEEIPLHEGLARLTDVISREGFVNTILNDSYLLAFVMQHSSHLPETVSISERCYVTIHGQDETFCGRGNHRTFNTLQKGYYKGCGDECLCVSESRGKKFRQKWNAMTPAQKEKRMKPLHAEREKAIANAQKTCLERYGVTNPLLDPAIREKSKQTHKERYGVESPFQSKEVQEKARKTFEENHGYANDMRIARKAYCEQTGYENPFQSPEVKETIKKTLLEKFGVDHPLKAKTIKEKRLATYTSRYGRASPMQAHLSDRAYAFLQDEARFKEEVSVTSTRSIAMQYGIDYNLILKYCKRYGVDRPKSSYETEITNLLREDLMLNVETGNRRLISPFEIDIVCHDHKFGIEFCGLYWHSDKFKPGNDYHLVKHEKMREKGYRLISIFEDEWVYNQDACIKWLCDTVGYGEVVSDAITIEAVEPDDAAMFFHENHVASYLDAPMNLGVFMADEMIACFGCHAIDDIILVEQIAEKFHHVSLWNTFFAHASEAGMKSVAVTVDRRWDDGDWLLEHGFVLVETGEPRCFGIDTREIMRIKHEDAENDVRIWDCGTRTYVREL